MAAVGRTISYSLNPNEILVAFSQMPEPFVHAQQMRINVADRISAVIARLARILNVSAASIVLIYNNNQLHPDNTAGFYGLANNSHLLYIVS